jgi:hypothetical protein
MLRFEQQNGGGQCGGREAARGLEEEPTPNQGAICKTQGSN